MLGLYAGAFLGMLSETSMNIALPDLCDAFNITTGTAQWMVVGYMLAIGIVLPCVGFLLKWIKAKTLVLVALACFLVGSVLSAAAPVFALVLAGRIIQGVGTGIVLPTMYAAIMRVFPPAKIGAANGVAGLVIMFAPVIGPTLAGLIIGACSWRAIFVLFAVVAAVAHRMYRGHVRHADRNDPSEGRHAVGDRLRDRLRLPRGRLAVRLCVRSRADRTGAGAVLPAQGTAWRTGLTAYI